MKRLLYILWAWVIAPIAHAQFDFCQGTKGDPIFFEDFGTGLTYGPALSADVTSYTFISGRPEDGQYSIYHTTGLGTNFHNSQDHTPGDVNGKCLIVNADYTPGQFYRREVNGLCINTTFEFTAWVMNVYNPAYNACPNMGIPVNVKFQIWNAAETQLLAEMETGNITGTYAPLWQQYGLTFTTVNETSVVLKMLNNAPGGCGNDLAIDDIMFRSCGAQVELSEANYPSDSVVCADEYPVNLQLNLNLDEPQNYVYQWQMADANGNFVDLPGETGLSYTTVWDAPGQLRVKIAQDIQNMQNPYCYTTTEVYQLAQIARPEAPEWVANVSSCEGDESVTLQLEVPDGITVNWYAQANGGEVLLSNTTSFSPTTPGTYYAEALSELGGCTSLTRTPVRYDVHPAVQFPEAVTELHFCNATSVILDAGIAATAYEWNNDNGTTRAISVSQPGTYTVKAYNQWGCMAERQFIVHHYHAPVISRISNTETTLTIALENTGDFSYSLDGEYWQSEPEFTPIAGGSYTVYVKENNGCGVVTAPYLVLLPMRFFTPNGDGINDYFTFTAFAQHTSGFVRIFDRYGRFLKELTPESPNWDGTFNNRPMPSSDYWFVADLGDGRIYRGHFTLKR